MNLPKNVGNQVKVEFQKQAEIYRGIEATDREIFLAACKDSQITRSQEISGYLQQELVANATEGENLQQDYLKMLTVSPHHLLNLFLSGIAPFYSITLRLDLEFGSTFIIFSVLQLGRFSER